MAAQVAKPFNSPTNKRGKATDLILKTKQEHPDLTTREIGAIVKCSHVNVAYVLKRYGINHERLKQFKSNRADILAGLQEKILNTLTPADIKKMPGGSRVLAACQLYDKERLERDLSTANVASVMADIAALKGIKPVE